MSCVALPWSRGSVCAGGGHGVTTSSGSKALMARARVQGLGGEAGARSGADRGDRRGEAQALREEMGPTWAPDGNDNYDGGDDNYRTEGAENRAVERAEGRGRNRQK
jgi:hypothetical protein